MRLQPAFSRAHRPSATFGSANSMNTTLISAKGLSSPNPARTFCSCSRTCWFQTLAGDPCATMSRPGPPLFEVAPGPLDWPHAATHKTSSQIMTVTAENGTGLDML